MKGAVSDALKCIKKEIQPTKPKAIEKLDGDFCCRSTPMDTWQCCEHFHLF